MNKLFLCAVAGLATLGFGCTSAADIRTNDFTPPTGASSDTSSSPIGKRRLLTATSTDGVHFTPTGNVFADQANVPDAVVTADGTIYVYYIGQGIEAGKETMAVAISNDNGATWTYRLTARAEWPEKSNRAPSDPDIVLLDDGTFRLFFTTNVSDEDLGIAYAESTDGITFTYKGIALHAPINVVDSSTMYFNDMWHMYVLDEKLPKQHYATSTDGVTFTLADPSVVTLPKKDYFISNPTFNETTLRMFGFSLRSSDIRSFTTTDATTWTADDIALDATTASTLGSGVVQDMAVAELADGTYLMVYVTEYTN